MLLSLSLILICGFLLSGIMQKLKLPGLLGMILTGIMLRQYALDLIAAEILNMSTDLREIALIVITALMSAWNQPANIGFLFIIFWRIKSMSPLPRLNGLRLSRVEPFSE